jgi:preprotein translocase subunit SecB
MSNETQVSIQRLYIKDCSFESPQSPKVFAGAWKPSMKVDLNNTVNKLDGDNVEVVLTVSVTAELEGETAFLVEVQQAALFTIKGLTEEQFGQAVNIMAPTTIFPYLREAIDALVIKGGFPAVGLQPVNFEAAYQKKMATEPAASH